VGRKEAFEIQIEANVPSVLPEHQAFLGGELYSEDLY
jgi:hypothetical protein